MRVLSRIAVVVVSFLALPLCAQTLVVTNSNLQGWTLAASPGVGDVPPPASYLAPGFEVPPLGQGSVHLTPGADGGENAQARHNGYAGVMINQLTALSYSTYVEVDGSGGQAPYLILNIDLNGDPNTVEDQWFFEPLYQSGAFFPPNPQGPLMIDTWQNWNALAGGWWTTDPGDNAGPGGGPTGVKSIASLLGIKPNATIANSGVGGSVRIVTGFGAGAWDGFLGAADAFRIATAGFDTTYDFEPDPLTTVTVTPTMLAGWTLMTTNDNGGAFGASSTIVNGPGTPPLGTGSLQLDVGPDGDDSAEARLARFDGLFLRDLTELDYQTFHQSGGSGGQLPYVILRVDFDNNGTQDDLLFFEPAYQTGGFCPTNPQPAIAPPGTWQPWDAANGCWWSLFGTAGATPGVGVKPLGAILDAQPDTRLVTGAPGGSVRIVAGFGAGAWDNFIGNVDAFNISFQGSTPPPRTIYDFDPDPAISIADLPLPEGNLGPTAFNFNVTLNKPVSYTVTVQYATANDTATTADNDYTAVPLTTITFNPNDTSETATVNVTGDPKHEADETFFVNLSNNVGAAIADAQAVGTIQNDDPQPTLTIADVSQNEGNAGPTNFVFNVTLSNPSAQTITVDYATAADTATAGTDYTTTSGTVTFNPGVTMQTITVVVSGETVFEPDETFFVNLSNITNATFAGGDTQALGTIQNDDAEPTISINDVPLAEGNAGTTAFTFNVTLSNPSSETITVDYATAADTATAGTDYTTTSGTVTFAPGDTTESVTVNVTGDMTFEPDETFFVNLTNPTNATTLDAQGLGTIQNDDVEPTISIDNVALAEGNAGTTAFTFNVTLSNPSSETITVDYATAANTAAAGTDYTTTSGTVTFVAGDTAETITVNVIGETVFEADETFFVNLTNPAEATIADAQGTGTIENDDAQPTISIGDVALAEGNAGTTNFIFNVTLSNASYQTITVDFATAANTATAGADYTTTSGTITFTPGVTMQTITVAVTGETMFEPDETFFVNLTNPTNATTLDAQGLGTIQNDDTQPTISIGDVALAEGNAGTTSFVFNVTLSNASYQTITVDYATAPDTATAGTDYTTTSGTVTFNPGDTAETITVLVTGDTEFESDETFFVNLSNPANATTLDAQGLGTIQNDEGVPTISIGDVPLAEGNAGTTTFTFNVTLSTTSAFPVTVDYATANDTATAGSDYTSESGTVTFAPGDTAESITIDVTGDVTFEPDETFFVNLTNPSGAAVADNQGLGTIENDDAQPTISIDDVALAEGNAGTTAFTFNVTLSGPSSSTITVDYATAPNTATAGSDYGTMSGTVTFAAGDTAETITIHVIGDVTFEADETFFVNVTNPTNATTLDAQGLGTIQNDDAQPTISIDDVALAEGNAGTTAFTFNVTLSGPSSSTITVDYATAPNTATAGSDYGTMSGTVTFAPGDTAETVAINVIGDVTFEADETFFVNLTNPTNATTLDAQGLGTIQNDDAQPTISINDVALAEGNAGTTPFVFDVTLSGPSAFTVTVDYATAPNTATAGNDYTSTSGTVTFAPGVTAQTVTVNVLGDTTFEADETFFVNLTNPANATIADAQGLGTIQNDDAQPSISIDDVALAEGNAGTTPFVFNVTLSNPSDQTITVDYATAPNTATAGNDYTSTSGTVTFAPGVTGQTITVNVLGDTTFEADETFYVNLTNPTNATTLDAQGLGTIQNDDAQPSISIGDVALAEGNAGTTPFVFNVTLSNPSDQTITVDYATAPNSATAGNDYTSTSGTVTFAPGDTTESITVNVLGDMTLEPDETFFVNLTNPSGAAVIDAQGLGTIQNDEGVPTILISDVTENEGDAGTNAFVFNVTLSGPSASTITVDFATSDGSATAGSDYTSASGTVTFVPGDIAETITVNVTGDPTFESDETFFVHLSNASGAALADNQGLGTIVNDDLLLADLEMTKTGPARVDPGAPITYTITVTNDGPQIATLVTVTDTIPAGTTFVSATPSQGSCSGTTTVTCNLGTVGVGASATITLVVNAPQTRAVISNTATVIAAEPDPTPANNAGTTATQIGAADIPTLSGWMLIALAMGLALFAVTKMR